MERGLKRKRGRHTWNMLKPTNHGIVSFFNRIFLFEISATIWMDVFEKSIDLMFIVTFNDTKNGTEKILLDFSIKNVRPNEVFVLQCLISNIWSEYIHLPIISRFATKNFLKFRNTTLEKIDFLLREVMYKWFKALNLHFDCFVQFEKYYI